MWTKEHGLTGKHLRIFEILVRFCLTFYFKIFYDIKVKRNIVDAPYHVLTTLRILKTQPKVVRDCITFYIRTGAWFAHSECLLLSLLSSSDADDREFAVKQILIKRNGSEYGDDSVRPRITPKINLSATSLTKLISWTPNEVEEPIFTCSRSSAEIKTYLDTPFIPPSFSCHTQSTERYYRLNFLIIRLILQNQSSCNGDSRSGNCGGTGSKGWSYPNNTSLKGGCQKNQNKE